LRYVEHKGALLNIGIHPFVFWPILKIEFGFTSFPDDAFYLSGKNSAFFNLKASAFCDFRCGAC